MKENCLLRVESAIQGAACFTTAKTAKNLKAFWKGRNPRLYNTELLLEVNQPKGDFRKVEGYSTSK